MACERVSLPGGGHAIVCGTRSTRKERCACGRVATRLCDWKVPAVATAGGHATRTTCDAPICAACATSPAPDKDICPAHAPALRAWQENRRAS